MGDIGEDIEIVEVPEPQRVTPPDPAKQPPAPSEPTPEREPAPTEPERDPVPVP